MKTKMIKIILPTLFGILTVLGLLAIFHLIVQDRNVLNSPDNGFLKYFVPLVTSIAMTIQLSLTLPFWYKFKTQRKVWGMTLIQFTGLLCIISGLAFGLLFWEISFGIQELILVSLTGIIAFTVYWTVNLLTLSQLDKRIN